MRRLIVLLLLTLCALPSWASVPKVPVWFWYTFAPSDGSTDFPVACATYVRLNRVIAAGISGTAPDYGCKYMYEDGRGPFTGSLQYTSVLRCPPNTVENSAGECVPSSPGNCSSRAGTSEIVNITAGWARSASETKAGDQWVHTYKLPPSGSATFCGADNCAQTISASEACAECAAYTSQVPNAQGLYRKSVDFMGHYSGEPCVPSQSDISSDRLNPDDNADAKCPGYVGEVNGVATCVGNAQNPLNLQPADQPAHPQDRGNPPAGAKPSAGEGAGTGGAGRTPNTGTGGSAGGPSAAAVGSGSSPPGTVDKPGEGKEQAACGAPGQPKCRIDETGTPDGKGVFDAAKKQIDDADKSLKDTLDGIKNKGDKDTSWGQTLGWVQHGGCAPWDLGTLPIGAGIPLRVDICPIVPYVEWVTSFLWAITTFALTLAMVFRVTTSSGS